MDMLAATIAAWMLAAAPPVNVEQAPPSALAHQVAGQIGALVRELALVSDESVSAEERGLLVVALERTGLFELVESGDALAVLRVSRVGGHMTGEVDGRNGERLWSGRIAWPKPEPVVRAELDEPTRQLRVMQWQNQRLRVMAAERNYVGAPFSSPQDTDFFASTHAARDPADWQMSYAGAPPVTQIAGEWVIVRGPGEVIDDLRLAQLLADDRLVTRIEAERFWPRVWWSTGFGAGAIAGITSGVLLMGSDEDDTRTVGISLLTAGLVAAAVACLSPLLEPEHVLTSTEAEALADVHNDRLRQELGLEPTDVHP